SRGHKIVGILAGPGMLEGMIFTVASYNIHKGCGLDRRVKLDRIAAVLEEIDADLVGLQEVLHPQADALAERLGMHVAMGPTHDRTAVPYGNAVLTRFPIHRTHPAPLPIFPLDRIYWDRHLVSDGFHVHRSRLARVASDHLPVVARLRMNVVTARVG